MPVPLARAVLFLKLRSGMSPGSTDLPGPPRAAIRAAVGRGQHGGGHPPFLAGAQDDRVLGIGAGRIGPFVVLLQRIGEEHKAVVPLADGDVVLDANRGALEPEAVALEAKILFDLAALDP